MLKSESGRCEHVICCAEHWVSFYIILQGAILFPFLLSHLHEIPIQGQCYLILIQLLQLPVFDNLVTPTAADAWLISHLISREASSVTFADLPFSCSSALPVSWVRASDQAILAPKQKTICQVRERNDYQVITSSHSPVPS